MLSSFVSPTMPILHQSALKRSRMSSSKWISSGNPFTAETTSSTNPFTSDTSEEELEGPRPGPVSKLFGLSRFLTKEDFWGKSIFVSRQEREAREGKGRKGSEEKLLPLLVKNIGDWRF